ncbi:MAG: type IV pili twitching motility protein PilT, partial [Fimbriimonadales bacterium]
MEQNFDWRKLVGLESTQDDEATQASPAMDVTLSIAGDSQPIEDTSIEDLLQQCVERGGSDLHLTVGLPPTIRLSGHLTPLPYQPLTPHDTRRLIYEAL